MFELFKNKEINSLKTRILELEEENKKLLFQVEKKDENVKKYISSKQEAERELNETKNKILYFENEISKLKKETSHELNFRYSENLSRNKLNELFYLLSSIEAKTSTLITIYLTEGEKVNTPIIDASSKYLIDKIDSTTGKLVLHDQNGIIRLVFIPIFPIIESKFELSRKFALDEFIKSLEIDKTLVINAHAGETFIGLIENNTFSEHEIIRSSVMGKHSKGGWSQKRFQSLVEEDVKHHADKVKKVLEPLFEKNKDIQNIIAGGDGKVIKMITDKPLFLKSMETFVNKDQMLKDVISVRLYVY